MSTVGRLPKVSTTRQLTTPAPGKPAAKAAEGGVEGKASGNQPWTGAAKAEATSQRPGARQPLTAEQLGEAIAADSHVASYSSEADSSPEYFAVPFEASAPVTGERAMGALRGQLEKFFEEPNLDRVAVAQFNARDGKAFIKQLSAPSTENSPQYRRSEKAFARITAALGNNLTDVKVLKFGAKDRDGTLASDAGSYAYVVVGKTSDGKLAGILLGAVET